MDSSRNLLQSDPTPVSEQQRIYTTGYEGREVTDLPALLTRLDAILIDIRFAPSDRPIQWRKDYLKLLLKQRYLHVPLLGNRPQSEPGKFALHNPVLGIKIITRLEANILLMCVCKRAEQCHRLEISNKLKNQRIYTEEINSWEEK
jgi:hypothetical protein